VSYIFVRTKNPSQAIFLSAKLNEGKIAQAVNPIPVMHQLMNDLVGNVRLVLLFLTGLIVIVAGVGIFVSIYNSMSDRRREIAIMRSLGAHRTTVLGIILGEALLLCLGGGIFGLLLGHGLVVVAAPIVEAKAGLILNAWKFEPLELVIFPVLMVLAVCVGILPGLTAYRTDVAQSLSE
jgi:putative ABC transport system permease protein